MGVKPKVYITRQIPKPGYDVLEGQADVTIWDSDEAIPKADLIKNVAGIDALLCMLTDPIDKDVLEAAGPQLKIVATMSVGFEHIDVAECAARGIVVTNTPNVSTDSVAELTVALLLMVSRRLLEGVQAVKANQWGKWKPMWILGSELFNSTVGVMGFGRIGFGVAKRLKPFGAKRIIYNDVAELPYAKELDAEFVTFEELLSQSDFICVCCNLTPETRHRLNKDTFAKMKKNVILVNSGRGGVINHPDLYDALKSHTIQAAGLDVTDPEPLPLEDPLHSLDNCIITPHMGSNTWETRNLMAETAAKNVLASIKQEPLVTNNVASN